MRYVNTVGSGFLFLGMLILCAGCGKQTVQINDTIDIPANKVGTFKVEAKKASMLVGNWTSKGSTANVKGATDDTLVDFRLLGPNNEVLQKLDHPIEGNFSIDITKPGIYTFEFNNTGIVRSSGRNVTIKGTLTAK